MYSVADFGSMIGDNVRMSAYLAALERAVFPGCSVLDIGTGTGIFALIACRLGAGKVYGVDPLEAIFAAERMVADNACGARVELMHCSSLEVELPQPVDLVVSDMRGSLPLFGRHIPTLIDARNRLLAPGGTLIPRADRIWAAPLTLAEWYEDTIGCLARGPLELDLGLMHGVMANWMHRLSFGSDALLSEPGCWAELDYALIDSVDVGGALEWTLDNGGAVHGIGLWFEALLDAQARFSTGPGVPNTIYGRLVLPLARPLVLAPGERLAVDLQARLVGDEYLWRWETQVRGQGDYAPVRTRLDQSTFQSQIFSAAQLRQQADDHTPSLDSQGQWTLHMLSLMDGNHSLREIARQVSERFPEAFSGPEDALGAAKGLVRQFGRSSKDV